MQITDPTGHVFEWTKPKRIVSLVPSQTELLHALGLNDEVVGITKFCIHPQHWFRCKTRIGGTKNVDLDRVRALKPDLILANKEENERAQIEALRAEFPVWTSDIVNVDDALRMITDVGALCGKVQEALDVSENIARSFALLDAPHRAVRAAYLIWNNPMMSVNNNTFIHDLLLRAGFENVFAHRDDSRYPIIAEEQLRAAQPEVVLLSSEPFPFKEKHIAQMQQWLPQAKVVLVDGELFSWYGSRLLHSAEYFRQLRAQLEII